MDKKINQVIEDFNLLQKSGSRISREREFLYPRQYFQWYLRELGLTYEKIARYFKHDHSTVVHSWGNVQNMRDLRDSVFFDYTKEIHKYLQDNPISTRIDDARVSIQKTPEETLESVLNEIELVRGEYCTGKNDLADGGRIVLDALIKRLKG